MRDPLHWLDVKRKLALTFVGVCLLAFGVGGSLAATSASSALEDEILVRLRFQCRAYADALDADMRLLQRRVEDFASDGLIRETTAAALDASDPPRAAAARELLRRHLAKNKLPLVAAFTDLTLVDDAGAEIVSASGTAAALVPHVAAVAPPDADGPRHSGLLGDGTPESPLAQTIVVPLRSLDGARRLARLAAWVRTDGWVLPALRGVEREDRSGGGRAVIEVADGAGRTADVVDVPGAGPELRLRATGTAARPAPATHAGVEAGLPVAVNGWGVTVHLATAEALAPVAGLQTRFLMVGVALALAMGAILLFPMRFLARPLVELREAARRLEDGALSARVESSSEDEIGDLQRSFNRMAESIESRTRNLEAAAAELAAQRDRLDAVIASMRDGLVVLDSSGAPVLSNAAAKPVLDLVASRDPRLTGHLLCDEARAAPSPDCASCLFDPARPMRSCVVDAGGRVLEIHATRLPAGPDGRRGRVLVSRDVTDRVAQDERQVHQERLSVLGEVAAVMAHELNNPLAAISMFSQMAEQGLGPESPYREHFDVIRRNTETAKRAIRELLDYAAGAPPEVADVDVHAVLEDVARFLRPVSDRAGARVVLRLGAADARITGDEIQIRQVFVNLVVNALQAMGRAGGDVVLSTSRAGPHVVVDVEDTGPGVPAAARERIFDPFFTTKERGVGTGLGLPTARRIAELHGGGLELAESAPGRTVFRVRLRGAAAREGAA